MEGEGKASGPRPRPRSLSKSPVAGLHRHIWPGSPGASADLVLRKVCNRQDSAQLPGAGGREGDRAQGWAEACLQRGGGVGGPPLQGMQLGAPPLKIIHLKSVLSLTSSSVHEVLRRPVPQHSSLLSSVLYSTWQRPFRAWRSQQFPAAGTQTGRRWARAEGPGARGRGKPLEGAGGRGSPDRRAGRGARGGREPEAGPGRPGPPSQLPGTQTRHVPPRGLSPDRLGLSAFARPGSEPAATRRADSGTWQKQDGRRWPPAGARGGAGWVTVQRGTGPAEGRGRGGRRGGERSHRRRKMKANRRPCRPGPGAQPARRAVLQSPGPGDAPATAVFRNRPGLLSAAPTARPRRPAAPRPEGGTKSGARRGPGRQGWRGAGPGAPRAQGSGGTGWGGAIPGAHAVPSRPKPRRVPPAPLSVGTRVRGLVRSHRAPVTVPGPHAAVRLPYRSAPGLTERTCFF